MIYSLTYLVSASLLVCSSAYTGPLDDYLANAVPYANSKIENAIATPSGVGGTDVATSENIAGNNEAALSTGVGGTPDNWCPNYQYSWLRDQALVMTTVMNKYEPRTCRNGEQ